jgi:RHS repeat-associated protein
VWEQQFTYDAFGNLTKSVPTGATGITWQPGYSSSTNRYTLGGTSYDANGNVLKDTFNTYTWDAEGKNLSTAYDNGGGQTLSFTYDAFGRMVEASVNSTWRTYWYTQAGELVMEGTTILTGRWPTSSGTVETIGTSCCEYLHNDWLGNARIVSSTSNNTVSADQAYTPYGEIYNMFGANNGQYQVFAGTIADLAPGTTTPIMWDTPNRELSYAGRWLSPDPAGSGWNQYAYAGNNPLSNTDPLGLCDDTDLSDCPDEPTPQCGGPGQQGCGGAPPNYIALTLIFNPTDPGPNIYPFELAQDDAETIFNATNATLFYNGASGAIGGIGSSPANNEPSWTGVFLESLLKGPSTGPGSCLGVFTDTVTPPLKQLQSAAKNYIPLIVGALQSVPVGTAWYMSQLNNMVQAGAAEADPQVAAVVTTAGAAAATAAPYVSAAAPYALAAGAVGITSVGLGNELWAGFHGQCTW